MGRWPEIIAQFPCFLGPLIVMLFSLGRINVKIIKINNITVGSGGFLCKSRKYESYKSFIGSFADKSLKFSSFILKSSTGSFTISKSKIMDISKFNCFQFKIYDFYLK